MTPEILQIYQFCMDNGTQFIIYFVLPSSQSIIIGDPYLYPLHFPESCQFLWVMDIMSGIHPVNGKFGYYRPHAASNGIFST